MLITHLNFAKGFRGGERQTQILIEELSKQGINQKLVVRKNSELTARCKEIKNLEIIEISKPYIFSYNVVKDSTLLHAHETKALQFAYLCNLFTAIPYVVTRRVDNKLKTNILNTKMYKQAHVAVALSKVIEQEIRRVSPKATTAIIPSAYTLSNVNEHTAHSIKQRFHGKFLVGHVGALDEKHKGQSFLIKAAKELQHSHPNIHFLFLGRGDDEMMLKEMAKDATNITFEGFVDNVSDYISTFDLFAFPSRNEGLGSILFDVMQCNVPIIASNVGGIPDIITHKHNGILVPPCNAQLLQKAVLELYGNQKLREQLANNAKKDVEKFSPSNMAQSYIKLYQKF